MGLSGVPCLCTFGRPYIVPRDVPEQYKSLYCDFVMTFLSNSLRRNLFILSSCVRTVLIASVWAGNCLNLVVSERMASIFSVYSDRFCNTTPLPLSGREIMMDGLLLRVLSRS